MVAIITGDIVNSDRYKPELWVKLLKKELNKHGKSPSKWELYRGDSFQLEVEPKAALNSAVMIKAAMKQIEGLDVRMAIGIGEKKYKAKKITESNGSAFVNSGRCFESLNKTNLAIKSPWEDFDLTINTMLELALLTMDSWTVNTAEVIKLIMENSALNQDKLSKKVKKSQSNISAALNRGGYNKMRKMIEFYEKNIIERC